MLKLYCQKCGALNAYVSEKPNFCQKCGQGFGLNVTASDNALLEDDDVDDNEEPVVRFNLQGLDVEIDSGNSAVERLGTIAGSRTEEDLKGDAQGITPPEGIDTSYTEEDFRREAGNIRGGNEAEET